MNYVLKSKLIYQNELKYPFKLKVTNESVYPFKLKVTNELPCTSILNAGNESVIKYK